MAEFERDGFVILDSVLPISLLERSIRECESELNGIIGTRNLLKRDWCRRLANDVIMRSPVRDLAGNSIAPVQCTYFAKTERRNWLVPLHRDLKIPVRERIVASGWKRWSVKEGNLYVQPPNVVLEQMIAVRIHFEDNSDQNGALQVIPGSQKSSSTNRERTLCHVSRGGALVMRPLILHASSKIIKGQRRVLHFLFGPTVLPDGAEWPSFD